MSNKNKTVANDGDVRRFLENVHDEKRRTDAEKLFDLMDKLVPDEATMWGGSIVGFGNYHYKYESGREGDFFKVGFSPRKQNLSVYIMPGFDRYEELMQKLGKYKTGKSCLYINKYEDVDESVLAELIKESYDYMTEKYG